MSQQEEYPLEFDPVTEEAMQSVLDIHCIFLDMSRSTTAGYIRHGVMELRRAKAIISAPEKHILKQPRQSDFQKITIFSSSKPSG
jgi:hypothetical protein